MFKNKPDMPLGPEIVAISPNGTPTATKIRLGMKSSSVRTAKGAKRNSTGVKPHAYTIDAARRVMMLMVRLLEVAAHTLGDRLNPKSLLAALLRIDSLNASDRREVIKALGPDVEVFRSFLTNPLLDALNSTRLEPRSLAPHLKAILRGSLGVACWGTEVTERKMANAVTSNLMQMAAALLRGPKASRGVVMWGSSSGRETKGASVKPEEPPVKPVLTSTRSGWPKTEERSIWASR